MKPRPQPPVSALLRNIFNAKRENTDLRKSSGTSCRYLHPVEKRKPVFTLQAKMLLFARCLCCLLLLILHHVPTSQQCHNLQHQGSKTHCRRKGACTARGHWWEEMFSCCGFHFCPGRARLSARSHLQCGSVGTQSSLERSLSLLVLFVVNTFWPFWPSHLGLRLGMVTLKKRSVRQCQRDR